MEWKCLHVEESARREEISLLDWKTWRRSSLARSVMCIFIVFGWFLEIWNFSVRSLIILFSVAMQTSLRPLHR